MKFKIDENLPVEVADLLRESKHDAKTVVEQSLGGKPDSNVASVCKEEARVLLTLDTGFGDIRVYPPQEFSGIVVLALKHQDKPYVLAAVKRLIKVFLKESVKETLWIVEDERIRVRQ